MPLQLKSDYAPFGKNKKNTNPPLIIFLQSLTEFLFLQSLLLFFSGLSCECSPVCERSRDSQIPVDTVDEPSEHWSTASQWCDFMDNR